MRTSFKVEIQPTPRQLQSLLQHAGNARWAYNWGLARKKVAWDRRKAALRAGVAKADAPMVPTAIDLHRELNTLKKLPVEEGGVPWMYTASKCAPQESLRNLDGAYKHFFRRCKNGEVPGYPRFKSRNRGVGGFRLTCGYIGAIRVEEHTFVLPTLGRVRIKPGDHGYITVGNYSQAMVSEHVGRWYVSVLGPDRVEVATNPGPAVGIDMGVARLATLSDGSFIENPRALATGARRLKQAQRRLSRKKKGSVNRYKARAKVARAHARISNVRRDTMHKATTILAKNHSLIVIEDIRVKNMVRKGRGKHGLNRVMHDASLGEFRRQLEYKAKLYGSRVVAVHAAYTSQRCSVCGHTEAGNRISQSVFCCLVCGHSAHADYNAAINILVAGSYPETINACGAGVRRGSLRTSTQLATKQESVVV